MLVLPLLSPTRLSAVCNIKLWHELGRYLANIYLERKGQGTDPNYILTVGEMHERGLN